MSADGLRRRTREKLREQRKLTLALLRLREQLGGSLFARYGECGKESCACQKGQKHGPYWVLSTRGAAGSGFAYLSPASARGARRLVERYRAFKSGLRALRRVNGEIVDLLRRYQSAMAKAGGRRLGVAGLAQSQ